MNDFLIIAKEAVSAALLKMACEQTGCKLWPDHADHDTYKVTAADPMSFFHLGEYIGKIHAQAQFR